MLDRRRFLNALSASSAALLSVMSCTIPTDRIDPIGKALLDLLPMPTFTDRLAGNYLANPIKTLDDYQGDLRIDHNVSNNDRLFGRFSFERAKQYLPTGLPEFGATGGFSSNQTFKTRAYNIALSETHVFKNNVLNQFTAGYNRVFNFITSFGYLSNKSRELGIPGANLGTDETSSLTRATIQNFVGFGDRGFSPFQGGTNVFHGNLFEYYRGTQLEARDPFSTTEKIMTRTLAFIVPSLPESTSGSALPGLAGAGWTATT